MFDKDLIVLIEPRSASQHRREIIRQGLDYVP